MRLIFLTLLGAAVPVESQAQTCANVITEDGFNQEALSTCLAELSRNQVPSGAVMAFDRHDGCPVGWSNFDAGMGRMIVGVDGGKYRLPYEAGEPVYVTGGSETHKLTVEEMPAHSHSFHDHYSIPDRGEVGNGTKTRQTARDTTRTTSSVGSGMPHNNMPPYIALYYCKKE